MTKWPAPQDATNKADCKSLCKHYSWYSNIIESLLASCDTKHLHLWLFLCLSLMMSKSSVFKVSKQIKWIWPFTKKGSAHIPKRVLWTPNPPQVPPSSPWEQTKQSKRVTSNSGKHKKPKIRTAYPCFFPCIRCRFHKYDVSGGQIQSPESCFFRRYSIHQADVFNLGKSVWQGYCKAKELVTNKSQQVLSCLIQIWFWTRSFQKQKTKTCPLKLIRSHKCLYIKRYKFTNSLNATLYIPQKIHTPYFLRIFWVLKRSMFLL